MPINWIAANTFKQQRNSLSSQKMHGNLQPVKAKVVIEEVADAVAETVAGLHQHTLDFLDFKPVSVTMLREWNEGLDATGRSKGE